MKNLFLTILGLFIYYQSFGFGKDDILPGGKSAIKATSLGGLFDFAKDTILGLMGLIAIGVFIFIGSRLVVAKGNPEEFKKALMHLVYAVIGLFVVAIAWSSVKLISGIGI